MQVFVKVTPPLTSVALAQFALATALVDLVYVITSVVDTQGASDSVLTQVQVLAFVQAVKIAAEATNTFNSITFPFHKIAFKFFYYF